MPRKPLGWVDFRQQGQRRSLIGQPGVYVAALHTRRVPHEAVDDAGVDPGQGEGRGRPLPRPVGGERPAPGVDLGDAAAVPVALEGVLAEAGGEHFGTHGITSAHFLSIPPLPEQPRQLRRHRRLLTPAGLVPLGLPQDHRRVGVEQEIRPPPQRRLALPAPRQEHAGVVDRPWGTLSPPVHPLPRPCLQDDLPGLVGRGGPCARPAVPYRPLREGERVTLEQPGRVRPPRERAEHREVPVVGADRPPLMGCEPAGDAGKRQVGGVGPPQRPDGPVHFPPHGADGAWTPVASAQVRRPILDGLGEGVVRRCDASRNSDALPGYLRGTLTHTPIVTRGIPRANGNLGNIAQGGSNPHRRQDAFGMDAQR